MDCVGPFLASQTVHKSAFHLGNSGGFTLLPDRAGGQGILAKRRPEGSVMFANPTAGPVRLVFIPHASTLRGAGLRTLSQAAMAADAERIRAAQPIDPATREPLAVQAMRRDAERLSESAKAADRELARMAAGA